MGLFIQQDEKRTELQERIAADLRAKAQAAQQEPHARRDGIDDSAYLKGTKKTTGLAWAWIFIVIAVIAVLLFVIIRSYGA